MSKLSGKYQVTIPVRILREAGLAVYAEVIVRPLQHGTEAKIDDFLAAIGAHVVAADRALARRAAELRARHTALRLPDALSLATPVAGAAQPLTLDRRLQRIAAREPQG